CSFRSRGRRGAGGIVVPIRGAPHIGFVVLAAGGELERARRGREMRVREHVAPPNRPTEAVRAEQRGGKVRALFDGLVADLQTRRAADVGVFDTNRPRSEEYTSELQSRFDLVC